MSKNSVKNSYQQLLYWMSSLGQIKGKKEPKITKYSKNDSNKNKGTK
jgi:hypothetical protein